MKVPVSGALLDACVLGVLKLKTTYGYDLTQQIQGTIDVSESTLYPVLRRLLKESLLETYDEPFDGRNRRYYKITEKGLTTLAAFMETWSMHKNAVEKLLIGGNIDE